MPMKMKNKFLKRVRAVALAAVLFCTPIIGAVVVSPIQAEAATTINGLTINQKLQTINASSRYGKDVDYIVVHYTGAPGSAVNNATYFANGYRGASAHYFVGYSGEVWQSVSDSLSAWSVGGNKYPGTKGGSVYGKCTNYNSINIEMCVRTSGSRSDTSKDWYFENATINSTVKLVQGLMKKYDVAIWAHHGMFCSGEDCDLTFGLLHTVENNLVIYFINNLTDVNFKNTRSRYRISCRTERCLLILKLQLII